MQIRRMLGVVVAAGVLLVSSQHAGAQLTGGLSNIEVAPVTSRHVESMIEYLGVGEDVALLIRDMHGEVVDRHARALTTLQEMIQAAQEEAMEGGPDAIADVQLSMMKKLREFRQAMEGMRDQFFEQVKVVLPDESMERWASYERRYRREALTNIDSGIFRGASVDLVGLVGQMELDEEAASAVESLLLRYETELDAIVKSRIEMVDRFALRQIEETEEKGLDPTASIDMYREVFEEGAAAARETAGINDRYARLIRDALAGDLGADFDASYREAVFPMVYRDTMGDRVFAAAVGIQDLTEEQRATIEEMRAAYDRESDAIEERWAKAIRAHEADLKLEDLWSGRMASDGAREAEGARRALDVGTIDKVRSILTEAQRELLPEVGATDWRERGLSG